MNRLRDLSTPVRAVAVSALALVAASIAFGAPAAPPTAAPSGADVFAANCAACHLEDGTGSPSLKKNGIPDFTNPKWQREEAHELVEAVRDGKGSIMPSFKDSLSREEIAAAVAYVQGFPQRAGRAGAPRRDASDDDDHDGHHGRGRGRGRGRGHDRP